MRSKLAPEKGDVWSINNEEQLLTVNHSLFVVEVELEEVIRDLRPALAREDKHRVTGDGQGKVTAGGRDVTKLAHLSTCHKVTAGGRDVTKLAHLSMSQSYSRWEGCHQAGSPVNVTKLQQVGGMSPSWLTCQCHKVTAGGRDVTKLAHLSTSHKVTAGGRDVTKLAHLSTSHKVTAGGRDVTKLTHLSTSHKVTAGGRDVTKLAHLSTSHKVTAGGRDVTKLAHLSMSQSYSRWEGCHQAGSPVNVTKLQQVGGMSPS